MCIALLQKPCSNLATTIKSCARTTHNATAPAVAVGTHGISTTSAVALPLPLTNSCGSMPHTLYVTLTPNTSHHVPGLHAEHHTLRAPLPPLPRPAAPRVRRRGHCVVGAPAARLDQGGGRSTGQVRGQPGARSTRSTSSGSFWAGKYGTSSQTQAVPQVRQ